MNKIEIQSLIEKVIGKKGNLRTPSWWMRKLFNEVIEWAESLTNDLNKTLTKSINKIQSNVDIAKQPYIIVSGSGMLNVDGKEIKITNADKQKIYYKEYLPIPVYYKDDFTYLDLTHVDFSKEGKFPNDYISGGDFFGHLNTLVLGPNLNIDKVTSLSFEYRSIPEIIIRGLYAPNLTSLYELTRGNRVLESLDLSGMYAPKLIDLRGMTYQCDNLKMVNLSNFTTHADVLHSDSIFGKCPSLLMVDYSNLHAPNLTKFESFFTKDSVEDFNVSNMFFPYLLTTSWMFSECSSLTSLDLSS